MLEVIQVTKEVEITKRPDMVGVKGTVGVKGATGDVADPVAYEEECERAEVILRDADEVAGVLLEQSRTAAPIEVSRANDVVEKMVDSVLNNRDALKSLSRLRNHANYTLMHSVNVSILTLVLGRGLGLERDELSELAIGGILHDVGKMLVPDEILHKSGTLTKAEFKEMRNHVKYGVELLSKSKGISDDSIYVALQHHERMDGSGYPNGTPGPELHLFGRIGSIVDVYDSMTSARAYGDTPSASEAIKKIEAWGGHNFDPELVDIFVTCLSPRAANTSA
jgi:putative nucleotidyltransferase with HDIG domain